MKQKFIVDIDENCPLSWKCRGKCQSKVAKVAINMSGFLLVDYSRRGRVLIIGERMDAIKLVDTVLKVRHAQVRSFDVEGREEREGERGEREGQRSEPHGAVEREGEREESVGTPSQPHGAAEREGEREERVGSPFEPHGAVIDEEGKEEEMGGQSHGANGAGAHCSIFDVWFDEWERFNMF